MLATSGQPITCQGQDLFFVLHYTSGSIRIDALSSSGSAVPVDTYTESSCVLLPGHNGIRYVVTYSAGTVDVYGAA